MMKGGRPLYGETDEIWCSVMLTRAEVEMLMKRGLRVWCSCGESTDIYYNKDEDIICSKCGADFEDVQRIPRKFSEAEKALQKKLLELI